MKQMKKYTHELMIRIPINDDCFSVRTLAELLEEIDYEFDTVCTYKINEVK